MHTLTRAEVREFDRLAIVEYGLPGIVLMENAGAGAARLLHSLGIDGPVVIARPRGCWPWTSPPVWIATRATAPEPACGPM